MPFKTKCKKKEKKIFNSTQLIKFLKNSQASENKLSPSDNFDKKINGS